MKTGMPRKHESWERHMHQIKIIRKVKLVAENPLLIHGSSQQELKPKWERKERKERGSGEAKANFRGKEAKARARASGRKEAGIGQRLI